MGPRSLSYYGALGLGLVGASVAAEDGFAMIQRSVAHHEQQEDACACLNWKSSYDSGLARCGDAQEFASISMEKKLYGAEARKTDEDFCAGVAFYKRQNHSMCVNEAHFGPSKSWCLVSSKCSTATKIEKTDDHEANAEVSWKTCDEGQLAGGKDLSLADMVPMDLFLMAKGQGTEPSFMAIMAYPSASGVPEGAMYTLPESTLWKAVEPHFRRIRTLADPNAEHPEEGPEVAPARQRFWELYGHPASLSAQTKPLVFWERAYGDTYIVSPQRGSEHQPDDWNDPCHMACITESAGMPEDQIGEHCAPLCQEPEQVWHAAKVLKENKVFWYAKCIQGCNYPYYIKWKCEGDFC